MIIRVILSWLLKYSFSGKFTATLVYKILFYRTSDETYEKKLTCILYCVGEAAQNAEASELEKYADKIVVEFLGPSIASCQGSEVIQAAVLTSISQVDNFFLFFGRHFIFSFSPSSYFCFAVLSPNLVAKLLYNTLRLSVRQ